MHKWTLELINKSPINSEYSEWEHPFYITTTTTQQQNKFFNSLPTFIWENKKG